jgi:hypothetical protein
MKIRLPHDPTHPGEMLLVVFLMPPGVHGRAHGCLFGFSRIRDVVRHPL